MKWSNSDDEEKRADEQTIKNLRAYLEADNADDAAAEGDWKRAAYLRRNAEAYEPEPGRWRGILIVLLVVLVIGLAALLIVIAVAAPH